MADNIIHSLLDTDWYKLTMQQVIFRHFPQARVQYEFINRGKTLFPPGFAAKLQRHVDTMANLRLGEDEYRWLLGIRYMKKTYIEWLRQYAFDPSEVVIAQSDIGDLRIVVEGPWYRTALWEVPLLAMISELYFRETGRDKPAQNYDWQAVLDNKARSMSEAGCRWIDFGTRRRHSFAIQQTVVQEMMKHEGFRGTSNPWLAFQNAISPMGTYAHEAPMAMQAIYGPRMSNRMWMRAWVDEYHGDLGIALPDTLTSEVFLRDFDLLEAKLFDGIRQDSGDPIKMGERYVEHYRQLHIDPATKRLVPSDNLTDKKLIAITQHFKGIIQVTGGIGTFLTNDVGYPPLNIVMKMTAADFGYGMRPVVKLSDEPAKYTGTAEAIQNVKWELGL